MNIISYAFHRCIISFCYVKTRFKTGADTMHFCGIPFMMPDRIRDWGPFFQGILAFGTEYACTERGKFVTMSSHCNKHQLKCINRWIQTLNTFLKLESRHRWIKWRNKVVPVLKNEDLPRHRRWFSRLHWTLRDKALYFLTLLDLAWLRRWQLDSARPQRCFSRLYLTLRHFAAAFPNSIGPLSTSA